MSFYDFETAFVEVRFPEIEVDGYRTPADNFLKVKETLTRIGAPAYNKHDDGDEQPSRILWQSCHILYKRQKYYLVHFKEMFLLDGKESQTELTPEDLARRNAIALLLEQWGLIEIVNKSRVQTPSPAPIDTIKIIPFRDKEKWQLRTKYDIGKTRRRR